jgi:molecular chaperone GrpE
MTHATSKSHDQKPEHQDQETPDYSDQIQKLEAEILRLQDKERRALADYQNLQRRQHEERLKTIKYATAELIEALLQPMDHLYMAAAQLNDQGLQLILTQFEQVFQQFELEEIKVLGQPFSAETMEVIEKKSDKNQVTQVIKKGYRLHGQVIRVAQVVMG